MSQILKPKQGYKRVTLLPKHIIINIPKEWKIEIMGNMLIEKIQNGINIKLENYGKGFPIFEIESLYKSDIIIKQSDLRLVSIKNMKDYEQYKLKENDFVINRVSKVKEGVGKCLLVVNPIKNLLYEGNMIRVRIDNKQMNPMFLAFLTKSNLYFKYIQSTCKTTSLTSIDQGIIEKIPIPTPPLQEQQKIASILSNIDNLITNTQKIIEQTKSVKKGLMQKLLTKGIGHKKFKKVKWLFGKKIEIPEDWKLNQLSTFVTIQSGEYFTFDEFSEKGIPVLKIDNVMHGKVDWETKTFLDKKYLDSHKEIVLNQGEIVLALNRPITHCLVKVARLSLEDIPSILYQRVGRFLFKNSQINKNFFYIFLNSPLFKKILSAILIGSDQPYVRTTELLTKSILCPSFPEQQKIATILSNVDLQITSQTQYKEKLERLKKSLMQKLLTGEVRVTV